MPDPIRVLISKIGLDGHDRGAKLIVRTLRDAGMEVIYTGLWQTPASTVLAAVQEDVDVIGVSLLSAAHMTIMPELVRRCREAGIPQTPIVVGGIIPEQDKQPLRQAGVADIFNPGTSLSEIVESVGALGARRRAELANLPSPPELSTTTGLARAITRVVHGEPVPVSTEAEAGPYLCIGVTGAPGVGKSTFIGRLAARLRAAGRRVAVIAVDPSSPLTGGALLGDRLRMTGPEPDPGLFVRSLSSRGRPGGLAPHCEQIVRLLAAGGYPLIVIETVGAGQSDVEIRNLAHEVLFLVMPGAGDAIQFAKAGVMEVATAFVVNKADLPGADQTIRELRETLGEARPVWAVSSLKGEGLEPLVGWIEQRLDARTSQA